MPWILIILIVVGGGGVPQVPSTPPLHYNLFDFNQRESFNLKHPDLLPDCSISMPLTQPQDNPLSVSVDETFWY